jgi:hypothetical protein
MTLTFDRVVAVDLMVNEVSAHVKPRLFLVGPRTPNVGIPFAVISLDPG